VGTIRKCSSDTFEINIRDDDTEQTSLSGLMSRFGEKILESTQPSKKIIDENKVGPRGGWNTSLSTVNGYPCKHMAYNHSTAEKSGKQVPTYTKSESSKVVYVAGYYGIRFPSDWRWGYGMKIDNLDTYDFIGPFKTKSEMQTEVLLQNKRNV